MLPVFLGVGRLIRAATTTTRLVPNARWINTVEDPLFKLHSEAGPIKPQEVQRSCSDFTNHKAAITQARSIQGNLGYDAASDPHNNHATDTVTVGHHGGTLCPECRQIDVDAVFSLRADDIPYHGRPISPLRKRLVADCQLCDVVAALLAIDLDKHDTAGNLRDDGWHLRVFSCAKALRLNRTHYETQRGVILAVTRGRPKRSSPGRARVNESLIRGFIVPVLPHIENTLPSPAGSETLQLCGTEVNEGMADFDMIRRWLEQDLRPTPVPRSTFSCLVIDCFDGNIVQHDPSTRYLALSYVWGKAENLSQEPSNPLLDSPQTVRDAIDATLRIGERYLWVDRYCIPANERGKHLHVSNMDLIYGAAYATIVAINPGPSDGSDSGLYGISKSRNLQVKAQLGKRTFVSTLPHVSYHISRSIWAKRGWTYQEAVLSSRCLFFTPSQIYYASTENFQCESVRHSLAYAPRSMHQTLGPTLLDLEYQLQCDNVGHAGARNYGSHLLEYTKRKLTFEHDAVNAFRGILAKTARASFWGLPIHAVHDSDDQDVVFAKFLCWTAAEDAEENLERRKYFPSWSWASVCTVGRTEVDCLYTFLPHARFGIEQRNGEILTMKDIVELSNDSGNQVPEQTKELHVTSWVFMVELEYNRGTKNLSMIQLRSQNGKVLLDRDTVVYPDLQPEISFDLPRSSALLWSGDDVVFPALFIGAHSASGSGVTFLLLEDGDNTTKRIGLLQLNHTFETKFSDTALRPIEEELDSSNAVTVRLQ